MRTIIRIAVNLKIIIVFLLMNIDTFSQNLATRSFKDINDVELREFVSHFQQVRNMPYSVNIFTGEDELIEEEYEHFVTIGEPEFPEYDHYYYVNSFFYKDFFSILSTYSLSFRKSYEKENFQLHTFDYDGNLLDCRIIAHRKYEQDYKDYYVNLEKIEFNNQQIFVKSSNEIITYDDGGEDLMRIDVDYTTETTYDSLTYTITPDGYIISTGIDQIKRYFNFKEEPKECLFKVFLGEDGEGIVAVFNYDDEVISKIKNEAKILYSGYSFSHSDLIKSWLPLPIFDLFNPNKKAYPVRYNNPIYKGEFFQKDIVSGKFLIIEDWIFFYGYFDN